MIIFLKVMSPPCQPYTRQHPTTENDPRSNALNHLIKMLLKLKNPPKYFALENVIGFENSPICKNLLKSLELIGYNYMQFALSPIEFGIPNERPRYYLIAVCNGKFDNSQLKDYIDINLNINTNIGTNENTITNTNIIESANKNTNIDTQTDMNINLNNCTHVYTSIPGLSIIEKNEIKSYLLYYTKTDLEQLYVPQKLLEKNASWCMDIVSINDKYSSCFTKSYSKYFKGTGSILIISDSSYDGNNDNNSNNDNVDDNHDNNDDTKNIDNSNNNEDNIVNNNDNYSDNNNDNNLDNINALIEDSNITFMEKMIDTTSANNLDTKMEQSNMSAPNADINYSDNLTKSSNSISSVPVSISVSVKDEMKPSVSDSVNSKYLTEFRLAPETRTFDLNWRNKLKGKKLRFFSPNELLQLFGFIDINNEKKISKNQKRSRNILENENKIVDHNQNIDEDEDENENENCNSLSKNPHILTNNLLIDSNNNNDKDNIVNNFNNDNNNFNNDNINFFPANVTNKKSYELIGNSLSVIVVTNLLAFLLRSKFHNSIEVNSTKIDNNDYDDKDIEKDITMKI